MEFSISESSVNTIKKWLGRELPEIKSSHRAEAMARALGFRTNAALRAALRQGKAKCDMRSVRFTIYLEEIGLGSIHIHVFEQALGYALYPEAYTAIENVLKAEPLLSPFGFDARISGIIESEDIHSAHLENRRCMLSIYHVEMFVGGVEYLSQFGPRKTINPKAYSYALKHRAEEYHKEICSNCTYISNGMLIAAAIHLGYCYEIEGINAAFNISLKPRTKADRIIGLNKLLKGESRLH